MLITRNAIAFRTLLLAVCAFVALLALPALAQEAKQAPKQTTGGATLSGRGNTAKIIESDGTVTTLTSKDLEMRNRVTTKAPAAPPPAPTEESAPSPAQDTQDANAPVEEENANQQSDSPQTETGDSSEKPVEDQKQAQKADPKADSTTQPAAPQSRTKPKTPPQAKPAEPAPTPEQIEARKRDVQDLANMRKTGGAYFYDASGKPLSYDDLDARIKSGKVDGIKVVTLHQQEWEARTKVKEQEPSAKSN